MPLPFLTGGFSVRRLVLGFSAAWLGILLGAPAFAQVAGTALVKNAPSINGTLQGSVQVMTGQSLNLNSGAVITGDILLPGVRMILKTTST
jgi:hypothetical protein